VEGGLLRQLEPDGTLHPIPAGFDGDLYSAGWSKGGKVLGMGYPFHRAVGELRLPPAQAVRWRLLPRGHAMDYPVNALKISENS
jgi:hypothetical protein